MTTQAVYRCVDCKQTRQYGFSSPPDKDELVRIKCDACGQVRRHEFVMVEAKSFQ